MTRLRWVWIPCAVVIGCGDNETPIEPPPPMPTVSNVAVSLNALNNLSTVVDFETSNVDSARVVCSSPEHVTATPFYRIEPGSARIVVLGLLPETEYSHVVEASGGLGQTFSAAVSFSSGALPPLLANRVDFEVVVPRKVVASVPPRAPLERFNLVNIRSDQSFSVAFDDSGRIRWYRQFDVLGAFVSQLPNGNFAAFLGSTTGFTATYGYYAEFAPDGQIVGEHRAPDDLYTDNHEILVTAAPGGGWKTHLISYYRQWIDTSSIGGMPNAQIAGHQILRLDPQGQVEFMWNAWDHHDLDFWIDGPPDLRTRSPMDFDHPNSLEIDVDGHYILSNRNFGQVEKIHSGTAQIIWQLGGHSNDFTFIDDTQGFFSAQHSARVTAPGRILLFDNGTKHSPPVSRAVEYAIDEIGKTATLVWEHYHERRLYSAFLGSVQRLADGNTLVGFGTTGVGSEVTPDHEVVWEVQTRLNGAPIGVYRYVRIASLYGYEQP